MWAKLDPAIKFRPLGNVTLKVGGRGEGGSRVFRNGGGCFWNGGGVLAPLRTMQPHFFPGILLSVTAPQIFSKNLC